MSYTAHLDEDEGIQVASNQGWYDYCDWIEAIDERESLDHLNEYGWYEPAVAVADDLEVALDEEPPSDDVASTAMGLVKFIRSGDPDAVLVISSGIGSDSGDDDEAAD